MLADLTFSCSSYTRTHYDTVKMFLINTMLHVDTDFAGDGHGDVTYKQTFSTMFNIEY